MTFLDPDPSFAREQLRAVRQYYDDNTRAFQTLGQGADSGAIRRAVWGPGVTSRGDAFHFVDREIETQLPDSLEPLRVLDLGCGVGASLCWLAARRPIHAVGVTISGVQARHATQRIAELGLADRVRCLEASFLELPATLAPAHVAFAIESFVHAPSPAAFFQAAARHIVPGGKLIVCDDFRGSRFSGTLTPRQERVLYDFSYGWVAPSVVTVESADEDAAQAGFQLVGSTDLTPYLELGRPRDRLLGLLLAIGRRLPIPGNLWRSWVGGDALQSGLRTGLIEYRFVIWQRRQRT